MQAIKTSTPILKRCSHCKQWKPRAEFHKNKSKRDGLQTECSDCHIKYSADYKQAHREHYTNLERERYHRIQDEAGFHSDIREFYPGYRFLKALEKAEVVEMPRLWRDKRPLVWGYRMLDWIRKKDKGDDLLDDWPGEYHH